MVERFNRKIENFLRTAVNEKKTNRDICIPPFLLAYQSAVHKSTGKTPASVVFGAELRLPIDSISDQPRKEEGVDNYISHLQDWLKLIHAEVWLYNPKRTKGKSPKLQKSWEGPYIVVTQLNDVVYRIQKNPQHEDCTDALSRTPSQ
ncbi:hypothetical protein NQ315_017352 [Exocentrus adspersus]|uniref:Integrase p58-like C-terminal domain-containing protein n=1 Tax=Exocentrus adspersus TaxID=1586481 RepID=A0AAV8VKE6_9CUCU|nr:hypothetical protein NQ315_017352 [Exocentrus adspersus]